LDIKLVLLDRDGVLNRNLEAGVREPKQWEWLPGAIDALGRLAAGWTVMVVTNQAGIGRGVLSVHELREIHEHMLDDLAQAGTRLNLGHVLWCPHAPADDCLCRKPRPGLVRRALSLAGATPSETLLIGDHASDIGAAEAAGCWSVHVASGRGAAPAQDSLAGYLGSVRDLHEAALALTAAARPLSG